MADYQFKINITTKNGTQLSWYDTDFADDTDTIVSSSAIVTRINNMYRASTFVDDDQPSGVTSPQWGAGGGSVYLSASYTEPNTGSVVFTDTETTTNGGLDYYTFWGTKVCSVLGLPEGIPIYTENFKLSDDSSNPNNYLSGDVIADGMSVKEHFKLSSQARVKGNLVWDQAFGEGLLQWASGSTSKMTLGYDETTDKYRLSAPEGVITSLSGTTLTYGTWNGGNIDNNSVRVWDMSNTLTQFNSTYADIDLAINGDNGTTMFFDGGNDRVSINGTTNGGYKLQVNGTVNITDTLSIPGFANVSASLAVATGGSGMSNFAVTADGGSNQSITDGQTLDIAGGDGITTAVGATDTVTINIDAAQTDITSVVNSSLEIGRDADNRIKFGTDNQIIFEVAGGDNVIMKSSGEIEATTLDVSGSIENDDGYALFKRSSTGANSVLNVRQLSTGPIAEFGTDSANNQIVLGVGGHITGSGNIEMTGTGSFAGLEIGGGTFTSASLAAGGSGGGAITALNNATANELVTVGATTTELDAETYLTFDGVNLKNLHNSGTIYAAASISSSAAGTGSFGYVYSAGAIRAEDDVIAYHSSDERLKSNIITIENPIDKVKQLKGVEYEWNGLQSNYPSGSKDSGIIAQDVQKVLPQLVKEKKGGYLGVRHDRLVGLLVESIKEQQEQIDELKKEVEELKNDST